MIGNLISLAEVLTGGLARDMAVLDTALVAFWGCAQLSELTYSPLCPTRGGGPGVLLQDVEWGENGEWAKVALRGCKTAAPVKLQYLRVDQINNCLCLMAVLKRLASSCSLMSNLLEPLYAMHQTA
ncbi:hypothetical protein PCANC_03720 [Puccinia coronata f. sp. avenae]|uniref:Uncharacterized protein n=1 Tax=Puccinia coronata f. sp. avenae TaxID=200324 RepID=A0A2N5VXP7_9BASI|nr:hypothetical protein PCANC_03720 [Puccinia coronata f. sp. avenae]